jgi:hypothetical protein
MTDVGLAVDFIDERYDVAPEAGLSFGRAADVILDEENEFMSRVVGAFVFHQGTWWIQNRSSGAQLTVTADGGRQVLLPPGTSDPITFNVGRLRFEAGRSNYEIGITTTGPLSAPAPPMPDTGADEAKATEEFGIVPLNAEQRAMLALFARARLLDPSGGSLEPPANAEVAHELGWSLKKLDRKLDYLCARLSAAGVQGLRGTKGGEANDRRRRLIDHVLRTRLITKDDLPT